MKPVDAVANWVDDVVVGLNLCPFAAAPLQTGRVRWVEHPWLDFDDAVRAVLDEIELLVGTPAADLSTTLLVLPGEPIETSFEFFLDLVNACEALLEDSGVDALIQLAHFHPDYRFEGVDADDPANDTNRAPFPTVHLLRVHEVEEAVERHPDIDAIPERNQRVMRERAPADDT